jgi:hypothetical protein
VAIRPAGAATLIRDSARPPNLARDKLPDIISLPISREVTMDDHDRLERVNDLAAWLGLGIATSSAARHGDQRDLDEGRSEIPNAVTGERGRPDILPRDNQNESERQSG